MDHVEWLLSAKPEFGKMDRGIRILNIPSWNLMELYTIRYVFDENYVYLLDIQRE